MTLTCTGFGRSKLRAPDHRWRVRWHETDSGQHRDQQLVRAASHLRSHQQLQATMLIIETVKSGKLLLAMGWVINAPKSSTIRFGTILEWPALDPSANAQAILKSRVRLTWFSNRESVGWEANSGPLAGGFRGPVAYLLRLATIAKARRELGGKPQTRIGLGHQHQPAIAANIAAIERGGDPLATKEPGSPLHRLCA